MRRTVFRLLVIGPVLSLLLGGLAGSLSANRVGAQATDRAGADERLNPDAVTLVERYAPIIAVKPQDGPCDSSAEQYLPTSADIVLDNPHVVIRQIGVGNPVLMNGPTAADIFDMGEAFFIDFPGDAFEPDCLYERDFQKYNNGRDPVVYAHIATQENRPDRLAVQYWFFYYYNKYNNLHEGDWEGIQLLFDVGTIEEALQTEPASIGYSQHFGGEIAGWDEDKLERDGRSPVVYPAVGSHASYFAPALYLGRSGSQGFGCDTTIDATRRLEPEVVLLPDHIDDRADPQAWLMYEGMWGELRFGPFSGATGPITKPRWTEPVDWHDTLRDSSVLVPGGNETTTPFVNRFCQVAEFGSRQYLNSQQNPLRTTALLVIIGLGLWFLASRTEWDPVDPLPVVEERRLGQIVTSSARLYWTNRRRLLTAALFYAPLVLVGTVLTGLVSFATGPLGPVGSVLTGLTSGVTQLAALVVVSAAVMRLIRDMDEGGEGDVGDLSAVDAYRYAINKLPVLAEAVFRAVVVIGGLVITIVGIPWAIRQYVRYQLLTATIVFEDRAAPDALPRCSTLIRGRVRWWHTATVVLTIQLLLALLGVIGGLLFLIVANGLPLGVYSAITSAAGFVVLPYVAITTALVYGNVVAESESESEPGAPREADAESVDQP